MNHHVSLTTYVAAFVDELVHSGTRHAVISPGSRSTPLAMLMAEHPNMNVWLHIDERSAAFFALGIAKAIKESVVLVCTSGTAAANYYPAIIEAKYARVPLVVITADRPHELRDNGAPQAIDQIRLFGTYPKWFVDMALPEQSEEMLRFARMNAARANATASTSPAGPVHLNFPFREPLTPDVSLPDLWEGGRLDQRRYTAVIHGEQTCNDQELERLAEELDQVEKGLFVCGPGTDDRLKEAIIPLAERLQFPVLADPLSQLRTGTHNKRLIIDSYDAFLRVSEAIDRLKPEIVIRFGGMPVSKAFFLYIKKHFDCRHMIVDEGGGWNDPTLLASDFIHADPFHFCRQLMQMLREDKKKTSSNWLALWQAMNEISKQEVLSTVTFEALFEGQVFLETIAMLPENAALFVGNSMPVRDLDTFLLNGEKTIVTFANRGANGIDGVVSTALGASAVRQPLVLIVGDLSFYHDLNGLLAAKLHRLNCTIIVLNNDGGGIFSFLPQAEENNTHFEHLFGTPTGLDFRHVVTMYGGRFERIDSWPSFRQALKQSLENNGFHVIEVPSNRATNVTMHRAIWDNVAKAIRREWSHDG